MPESGLAGRLAIVTGAGGKLGPVWTRALRDAGAEVVGLDISEQAAADPGIADLIAADVTDRASVARAFETIERRYGTPMILVNNAGIDRPPSDDVGNVAIEDVPLEDFEATVGVNLGGTFNCTQVFGSAMRDAGRGSIVNIGSLYASIAPDPGLYDHLADDPPFLKPPAYGASKAGVLNLTRYFARLWGPDGVRVNSLSPGGVLGDQDPEFRRKYCARVPLGRMADPEDLGGPLVFLASDDSRYLSGQDLLIDGGLTA